MVRQSDWYNLYGEGWKGAIIDDAFSHPAKFSRALIRHIYEHAVAEGWLQEGNVVIDPFGGVALGGLDAMHQGLNWIGVELEQKFVDLGCQNIELWNKTIGQHMRRWGSAVLLQGDSRSLGDVIGKACEGMVSSPPYAGSDVNPGNVGNVVKKELWGQGGRLAAGRNDYGFSPGQLGTMPEGIFEALDAAISSPPYNPPMSQDHSGRRGGQRGHTPSEPGAFARYGNTPGQLEGLPMGEIEAAISSPPYSGIRQDGGGQYAKEGKGGFGAYTDEPVDTWHTQRDQQNIGNLREPAGDFEAMISSPPFGAGETRNRTPYQEGEVASMMSRAYTQDRQGTTEGNLGMMDAAISSPPYEAGCRHTGGEDKHPEHIEGGDYHGIGIEAVVSSPPFEASVGSDDPEKRGGLYRDPKRKKDVSLTGTYGDSPGQLGAMEGGFDSAISSPPFESSLTRDGRGTDLKIHKQLEKKHNRRYSERSFPKDEYGETEGQLGQAQAETFWSAAKLIVEQVYGLLKPGSHAIFVVKAFVRNKVVVDFPGQWQALCEHCGFETLHYHRAWLVEDRGAQYDLFGELHEKQVKRSSFFRRLYEKKYPENRIDWEVVLCMRKA